MYKFRKKKRNRYLIVREGRDFTQMHGFTRYLTPVINGRRQLILFKVYDYDWIRLEIGARLSRYGSKRMKSQRGINIYSRLSLYLRNYCVHSRSASDLRQMRGF